MKHFYFILFLFTYENLVAQVNSDTTVQKIYLEEVLIQNYILKNQVFNHDLNSQITISLGKIDTLIKNDTLIEINFISKTGLLLKKQTQTFFLTETEDFVHGKYVYGTAFLKSDSSLLYFDSLGCEKYFESWGFCCVAMFDHIDDNGDVVGGVTQYRNLVEPILQMQSMIEYDTLGREVQYVSIWRSMQTLKCITIQVKTIYEKSNNTKSTKLEIPYYKFWD